MSVTDRISPALLLDQVRSTAPWLIPAGKPTPRPLHALASRPDGFRAIIAGAPLLAKAKGDDEGKLDYFALCLACHHGSVASWVPTDVDAGIRGALWKQASPALRQRMWEVATHARRWSVAGISTRVVATALGPVSGHDGEHLSVACGAWGHLLGTPAAVAAQAWIASELEREAEAFRVCERDGASWDLLRLAWILTHNAGDVDQGFSYWPTEAPGREPFARLAHEGPERFGGVYTRAAALYKAVLAAEGHRNYPLRAARLLRPHPELLLPLGPCLDEWGRLVATHPGLGDGGRVEVLTALLDGWRTIPGQRGYQRAIAGLVAHTPGGRWRLERALTPANALTFRDHGLAAQCAVPEEDFRAELVARAAAVIA